MSKHRGVRMRTGVKGTEDVPRQSVLSLVGDFQERAPEIKKRIQGRSK